MSIFSYENSVAPQHKRILDFLHNNGPLDTLTARIKLDIMHPAAQVMELRNRGFRIKTIKVARPSSCGKIHKVACYVLGVGADATAPADKMEGIHRQETNQLKNSMDGVI